MSQVGTSTAGYVELRENPYHHASINIVDEYEKGKHQLSDQVQVQKVNRHFFSWLINSLTKYDGRTVLLIALQFFSEGAMFMICLTSTIMFSSHFLITPGKATLWLALICLPEGLSFFFGLFSDCVTVFGSQRRFYICLMALIQSATAAAVASYYWTATGTQEIVFAVLISICVMSRAWLTPVIESLMIIQMKKDPDYGADDLETFGLICTAFGQIFYCILGGELIKLYEATPQIFFWLIVGTGAITFFAGLFYPAESDGVEPYFAQMTTTKRLKTKFHLFYEALTLKEIRNLLIFFFIVSLCAPNLEEFLIYYNEMMLVTPLYEGYAMIVLFITGAAIFLIYNNSVMSKSEVHNTQYVAIVMRVISALFFAYDVAGKYPAGRTLMIQSFAIRSFVDAFLYLPGLILYSKMVPHHIEGMMVGFLWSMIKLNADVLARLLTCGLNLKFMVMGEPKMAPVHGAPAAEATPDVAAAVQLMAESAVDSAVVHVAPFMNLYKMYLIQAGMVAFTVFFVWMVAKRARVEEVQMVLHHREHVSKEHGHAVEHKPLSQAVEDLRKTQQIRLTVNNHFPQFSQAIRNGEADQMLKERFTRQLEDFHQQHLSKLSQNGRPVTIQPTFGNAMI